MTVYGVGRDQGMTSGPTKAIVAAVLGMPYRVSFSGPTLYQYAADVARTLVAASRTSLEGANVFNLPGVVADGRALAAAIEAVVPGAAGLVDFEPGDLPFPSEIAHERLAELGDVVVTPYREAIAESAAIYRRLATEGRFVPSEHGVPTTPVSAGG
jgi:hypothetical protein